MVRTIAAFLLFIIIPPIILTLFPLVGNSLPSEMVKPTINLFLSLYIMALVLFLFLVWMDQYLDMWIITTERVIDIEQSGLFSREISEIPIKHVQDVTIEVHGLIETFLKFGTIRIQTAGEREFRINFVPKLYEAKDTILKYAQEANGKNT